MKNKKQAVASAAYPWWQKYMPYLLGGLAFLLYANTIGNGYNMDDELVTRKHKLTSKGLSAIGKIFTSPYYSDDMGYAYEYRPVVLTSFAIEHQLFGDSPGVSHFFNVLLYTLTVLLLFKVLRKLFGSYSYWFSVIAVFLFVVHTLHTEVVASIKNRDEILALLGALGGWWFAMQYAEKGKWYHLPLAVLCFVGGILSKMSVAPGIVLIPLSVVLFFPVQGRRIALLSLLLGAASFAFLPFANPERLLPLYTVVVFLPYLYWMVVNRKFRPAQAGIRSVVNGFVHNMTTGIFRPEGSGTTESAPVTLAKLELNYRDLLKIPFILSVAVLSGLGTAYVLYMDDYLLVAWFLVFAFIYYNTNYSQKNILILVFTALFQWVCYSSYQSIYVDFGLFFLLFLLFSDIRYRNWFVLFLVLSFVPLYIYLERPQDLLGTCLAFTVLILRNRNKFWGIAAKITYAVSVIFILSAVFSLAMGRTEFRYEIIIVCVNILILLTFSGRTQKFVLPILLFLFLPFLHLLHDRNRDIETPAKTEQVEAVPIEPQADTRMGTPIVSTDRPISFAEVPVTQTSPTDVRVGLSADVLGFYLQKMLVPYPLGYYYGYAYFKPVSWTEPVPLVALIIHLALLLLAVWALRKHKPLGFALLWYLGAIVLFSGFLYPVVGVAGERFTYFASVGWCILLAFILIRFLQGAKALHETLSPNTPLAATVIVLGVGFGFLTLVRNAEWKDALTLMANDIDHLDESSQAHNLYALNLMRTSYEDKKIKPDRQFTMRKLALVHFDRALQIWPEFYNAAFDKGRAAMSIGDMPTAISGFEAAVTIAPQNNFMEPYLQLSELYTRTGRYPEFLVNAKRIFAKDSSQPQAYGLVAKGFYLNGRLDSAELYLNQGIARFPQDINLPKNLSEVMKARENR